MKFAISMTCGIALGFLACWLLFGRPTTKQHWKIVESYNAYVSNPSNYKPDASTGLSVTTPPFDLEPSLAALVAAGELRHVDMVLPSVPNSHEAAAHWMIFCKSHKEIVYITGNESPPAFRPAGTQPLHLNIWFKEADEPVIQTLVRELEENYGKKAP